LFIPFLHCLLQGDILLSTHSKTHYYVESSMSLRKVRVRSRSRYHDHSHGPCPHFPTADAPICHSQSHTTQAVLYLESRQLSNFIFQSLRLTIVRRLEKSIEGGDGNPPNTSSNAIYFCVRRKSERDACSVVDDTTGIPILHSGGHSVC
jgi:hypothetical protein